MPDATPWLDDILADVGTREIAGPKANPKIVAYYADVGHPEIRDDGVAWCAARVGSALKRCGYPIPPVNVNLLARSYLTWGVACEPKPGAIIVLPRGNSSWQGHVGVVVKVHKRTVDYVAGNQSDAVGYGKANIDDALGFRWPVEPTVAALRQAGSSEIKQADRVQNGGTLVTTVPLLWAAVQTAWQQMFGPLDVPKFASLPESLSWWQALVEGAGALARAIADHPWLVGTLIVGLLCVLVGRQLKARRVAKARAGLPLAAEVAKLEGAA